MKKFILQVFTEPDNKTVCPVRVIALTGAVQFLVMSGYQLVKHATFDPQSFALGFAAIIGGMGVALGLKKDSNANANG